MIESLPPQLTVRTANWDDDSAVIAALRNTIFVLEQGVPQKIEWDGQDAEARHVIAELAGRSVGCGRLLPDGRIGRLAVDSNLRGRGIGREMLDELLVLASHSGTLRVYLHAQTSALGFYESAGFTSSGEAFEEAGIEHLKMIRDIDYRDCDHSIGPVPYPQPFAQLVIAQGRLSRREIAVLSPRLDRAIFDNRDFAASLRILLRGSNHSRVRILIQDARAVVQRGHGLLELARRLPSGIELRKLAEHPDWTGDTQILRDRSTVLAHPGGEGNHGVYRPHDRGWCATALARYEELWRVASPDPEFRALSI